MRLQLLSAALVTLLAAPVFAADNTAAPAAEPKAAASAVPPPAAVQKLTFTNKLIEGKKTWLPADAKVPAGATVEITLVNTLADPHGFTAPGLTKEPIVVNGNETKTVTVTADKKGEYKFSCQLHPAHVGGEITVQ